MEKYKVTKYRSAAFGGTPPPKKKSNSGDSLNLSICIFILQSPKGTNHNTEMYL